MTRENLILEAERNLANGYKKYGSNVEQNAFLNRFEENESIKQPYTMRHKRNVDDDDYEDQGDLTTQSPETETSPSQVDTDATAQNSQREPVVQPEQGSLNATSSAHEATPEASFTQTTESLPSLPPTVEHNASSANSGQEYLNPITATPSILPITEATPIIIKNLPDAPLETTTLVPDQSEVWYNNLAITIPSGMSIFLVIFGLFFFSIKLLRKKLKSRKFKLKSKEDAKALVKLNSVSKSEKIELNEIV